MGGRRRHGGAAGKAAGGVFGKAAGWAFRGARRSGRRGHGEIPHRPSRRPNERARGDRPRDPRAAARGPDGRTTTKDPIDVVTGEVLLSQADVHLPGVLPLLVERTHISSYRGGGLYGPAWASTLDQHLRPGLDGVEFHSAEATVQHYPGVTLPNVAFRPTEGTQRTLTMAADGTYALADPPTGRTLHFPAPGEEHGWSRLPLVAITDCNGNRIDLDYRDGVLTELRHSGGYRIAVETVRLSIDGVEQHRIAGLRLLPSGPADAAGPGELIAYRYDEDGELSEVINSSGLPLRLTYDEGRLAGWADRKGHAYRYEYDDAGRAVRGIGTGGYLDVSLHYDPDDRVTVVTDSLGTATEYRYNELYQVVSETDPLGGVQRFVWDRFDRLLAHTDQLGHTVRYDYDEAGDLSGLTRSDGGRFTIAYAGPGLPVEIVEPSGAMWRRSYDDRGNLVAATDPLGAVTAFTYDERGRPTSTTAPSGARTVFEPDGAGLPLAVTDPLGNVTRYRRDARGRVVATEDPLGNVVRQGWTVEGAPSWRTLPDGSTERWSYDAEGNLVEYADAAGGRTRYEIGPFDLVLGETGPGGAHRTFAHDTELRLTAVHDPRGLAWRYTYDPAGRLIREVDFNGRAVGYRHDAAGRLAARTNGAGQTVSYERYVLGNVVRKTSPEWTTTFEYDRAGLLVRAVDPVADLRLLRDVLGRVTVETCNGRSVASAFDADGNRVRRRTATGAESAWTYDASGRATGVTDGRGGAIAFSYDGAGRETQRRVGAGTILVQEWDGAHRLQAQAVWGAPTHGGEPRLLQHRVYRHRTDGFVVGIADRISGDRRLSVDAAGRVTAVDGRGWTERYAYDEAGNLAATELMAGRPGPRIEDAEAFGERAYEGTLLRRAGRVVYDYDDQGRAVVRRHRTLSGQVRSWAFAWDSEDRLTGIRTPDGTGWRHLYDPLGRRIAKQRLVPLPDRAGGEEVAEQTEFVWDGPRLVEQIHRSGDDGAEVRATCWDYEAGTFRPLYQRHRRADASGEWIDEQFFGIVADLVGTPVEMVDEQGSVAWFRTAALWGPGLGQPSGGVECPLRFPGQYHDPESGLDYNYQRYYSPLDGRYLSPDPLGLTPQPDAYDYVLNPTCWVDPLGLCPGGDGRGQEGHGYARSVVPGGRPDGQKVFAGHGEYRPGAGEVTVPPGTRVAVYAEHGQKIHDRVGLGIERGTGRTPVRVYEAGENMPDYTLKAPRGLTIAQGSRTVEDPTNLSRLLKPRMGTVHWAACQEVRG